MLCGWLMNKRGIEAGTGVDKHQATGHKHQIYIHSDRVLVICPTQGSYDTISSVPVAPESSRSRARIVHTGLAIRQQPCSISKAIAANP